MLWHLVRPTKSFTVVSLNTRRQYPRTETAFKVFQLRSNVGSLYYCKNSLPFRRHPLRLATAAVSRPDDNNDDDIGQNRRMKHLSLEIAKLNGGVAINCSSRKQISDAIFGTTTIPTTKGGTSITKKILQQAAAGELANLIDENRQKLAILILEYRTLLSQQKQQATVDNNTLQEQLPPPPPPPPPLTKRPSRVARKSSSFSTLAPVSLNDDDNDLDSVKSTLLTWNGVDNTHQQPYQQPSPKRPSRVPRKALSFSTLEPKSWNDGDDIAFDPVDQEPMQPLLSLTSPMPESSPTVTTTTTTINYETIVDNLFKRNTKINAYWKDVLLQVSKPSARALISQLHPACPMGYDPSSHAQQRYWKSGGNIDNDDGDDDDLFGSGGGGDAMGGSGGGKKGTFLAYCREQKVKYGDCIILTRCGDFYETFGIDAILLVEHCGLNAMAGKARAGCPIRNIQATLNCLTEQGFRVAVYEEAVDTDSSIRPASKSRLKTRMLAQIVSSASPTYLYDLALLANVVDTFATSPASRPYVGILSSASGFTYVEVSLEERNVRVSERLTAEAVACRLAAYPPADPLLLLPTPGAASSAWMTTAAPFLPSKSHSSSGTTNTRLRTKLISPSLVLEQATGVSDVERARRIIVSELLKMMKGEVDIMTGRPAAKLDDFVLVSNADTNDADPSNPSKSMTTATNPLYVETATQLGLMSDHTIPSLVAYLVPDSAPAATRRFLRRWLLTPPPPQVATSMALLVSELKQNGPSLPPLSVPPIGKVLALLRAGQASAQVYGELLQAMDATETIIDLLRPTSVIIDSLMTVVEHESGMAADAVSLSTRCRHAVQAIERVISPLYHPHVKHQNNYDDDDNDDRVSDFGDLVPRAFFDRNESPWRGRIRPNAARRSYDIVDRTATVLAQALALEFWGLETTDLTTRLTTRRLQSSETKNSPIVQDIFNNLLALKKIPLWVVGDAAKAKYFHPRDRNGKLLRDRYTTAAVQDALSNYVEACELACKDVTVALSRLSQELYEEGHIPAIVQASHTNLILSTAANHAAMSNVLGWNMAEICDVDSSLNTQDSCANFTGLWPYWMDRSEAVSNSFELKGLFLLTAPNMSGKSTLMRATAAAALLSICGFCAPVESGTQIQRFDNIFVRGASADVPTEQKSAFGAEMGDIAALFRCCTDKSLVFVDELGRGTSPKDGTCLAGAVMEAMAKAGMSGIFATHLHDILTLPLEGSHRIVKKRMAIQAPDIDSDSQEQDLQQQQQQQQWTYRIEDGVCLDSMALVTAARFGLPDSILQRAASFAGLIPKISHVSQEKALATTSQEVVINGSNNLDDVVRIAEAVTGQLGVAQRIPPGWSAPASAAGGSYVYILELDPNGNDARYYVGETDALQKRLAQHRAKGKDWATSTTIVFPAPAGKTQARAFESLIIQKLAKAGFRLESTTDGRQLRPMRS